MHMGLNKCKKQKHSAANLLNKTGEKFNAQANPANIFPYIEPKGIFIDQPPDCLMQCKKTYFYSLKHKEWTPG